MTHRTFNLIGAALVVALFVSVQHLDEVTDAVNAKNAEADARLAAVKERRQQMARVEFCIKSQGPQSYPVEQEGGEFRCVGKRGQKGITVAQQ